MNDYVDAALCAFFVAVVMTMLVFGILWCARARVTPGATVHEEVGGVTTS